MKIWRENVNAKFPKNLSTNELCQQTYLVLRVISIIIVASRLCFSRFIDVSKSFLYNMVVQMRDEWSPRLFKAINSKCFFFIDLKSRK